MIRGYVSSEENIISGGMIDENMCVRITLLLAEQDCCAKRIDTRSFNWNVLMSLTKYDHYAREPEMACLPKVSV